MTRTFKDPEYHIFYDMGASSTSATLVKFHTANVKDAVKKKLTPVPEAEILAVGYDKALGGQILDTKLRAHLVKLFTEQHGAKVSTPIEKSPRAMMKLLKEANRVKQILSANQETISSVRTKIIWGGGFFADYYVYLCRYRLRAYMRTLIFVPRFTAQTWRGWARTFWLGLLTPSKSQWQRQTLLWYQKTYHLKSIC